MKHLLGCLLACAIGTAAASEDDFDSRCGPLLPARLAPTADTGVVIVDAALRAYIPVEMPIERGVAALAGLGKRPGIHSSAYQCLDFTVIAGLPAGRYRLSSIEGQVSSITLTQRFLYPMPGDGYQIINPHDWREGPQRYRVQPRRTPDLEIDVQAGAVSYLGRIEVVRARNSVHAVTVERRADAAREQLARERLRRLAGAPPTAATPPATAPPAAAAP